MIKTIQKEEKPEKEPLTIIIKEFPTGYNIISPENIKFKENVSTIRKAKQLAKKIENIYQYIIVENQDKNEHHYHFSRKINNKWHKFGVHENIILIKKLIYATDYYLLKNKNWINRQRIKKDEKIEDIQNSIKNLKILRDDNSEIINKFQKTFQYNNEELIKALKVLQEFSNENNGLHLQQLLNEEINEIKIKIPKKSRKSTQRINNYIITLNKKLKIKKINTYNVNKSIKYIKQFYKLAESSPNKSTSLNNKSTKKSENKTINPEDKSDIFTKDLLTLIFQKTKNSESTYKYKFVWEYYLKSLQSNNTSYQLIKEEIEDIKNKILIQERKSTKNITLFKKYLNNQIKNNQIEKTSANAYLHDIKNIYTILRDKRLKHYSHEEYENEFFKYYLKNRLHLSVLYLERYKEVWTQYLKIFTSESSFTLIEEEKKEIKNEIPIKKRQSNKNIQIFKKYINNSFQFEHMPKNTKKQYVKDIETIYNILREDIQKNHEEQKNKRKPGRPRKNPETKKKQEKPQKNKPEKKIRKSKNKLVKQKKIKNKYSNKEVNIITKYLNNKTKKNNQEKKENKLTHTVNSKILDNNLANNGVLVNIPIAISKLMNLHPQDDITIQLQISSIDDVKLVITKKKE